MRRSNQSDSERADLALASTKSTNDSPKPVHARLNRPLPFFSGHPQPYIGGQPPVAVSIKTKQEM
jgi:hypothetical protein